MSQPNISPESDATLIMTITRTATLTSETISSDDVFVSWRETTITTEQVVSKAVTVSPSSPISSREESTHSISTRTLASPSSTNLEFQQSLSQTSSALNVPTSATSELTSGLQFGDIPTSNSTQVGIAVGVPIAIFAVFFIAMAVWYFLRLRKSKRNLDQNNFDSTSRNLDLVNENYSRPSWETLTEKPYPVVFSPTNYLHTDKEFQVYEQQKPQKTSNLRNQLNRLSRLWPIKDKEQETTPQAQSSLFKRMSVLTPVFLKKFNLGDRSHGNKEVIKSQVLDIPTGQGHVPPNPGTHFNFKNDDKQDTLSGTKMYIVFKPYTKSLGDELTIRIGDKCTVLEKYSDGWCKIQLHKKNGLDLHSLSRETGLVPWMCLRSI
ncbi:FUS1 [Candida metapsilosis]|uniref:FUS1 n=1 Tax=Candida metapsilosis TaxID=273372 RepID=A0A8H7ZE02_9ASCO|nr:FUS1 [Candida metapsilosis]